MEEHATGVALLDVPHLQSITTKCGTRIAHCLTPMYGKKDASDHAKCPTIRLITKGESPSFLHMAGAHPLLRTMKDS